MRVLVLCLLLGSAQATTITGQILSGQIQVQGFGDDFSSWSGTFQSTGPHTVFAGGSAELPCSFPCTLEDLRNNSLMRLTYQGLSIDGEQFFSEDLTGLIFNKSSFFDVISGDFVTATGEATTFGPRSALESYLTFEDRSSFALPFRWRYTAHYTFDPRYLEKTSYVLVDATITPVPELGSLALTLTGMTGLGFGFLRKTISRLRPTRSRP